jgi:hypothetical protein
MLQLILWNSRLWWYESDQSRFRFQKICCKFTRTTSLHMGWSLASPLSRVVVKRTSFLWTSFHSGVSNQFILEQKNHLNKIIKSLSLFYPIHVTIESWISHDWSHHRYILTLPPHETGLISNNTYHGAIHAGSHPCDRITHTHNTLMLYRRINIIVSQLVALTQSTQPLERLSGQRLSQNIC